jgi:hypothetical protein
MSKFKVGDKVKCINDAGFITITEGALYTVTGLNAIGWLTLSGLPVGSYPNNVFKLVTPEPQFTAMYFECASVAENLEIQDALYEAGYKWVGGVPKGTAEDAQYLITAGTGLITWSRYLPKGGQPLAKLKVTKSYSFDVTEVHETVTLNGKEYKKSDLESALESLTPVS